MHRNILNTTTMLCYVREQSMRLLTQLVALILFLSPTLTQAETYLQDLQGQDIALSSLKGKWVFINYWASWCQPCLDEIPVLNRFYEANKAKGVAMFAVNYDALPRARQERFIQQFDIQYPSLNHNTGKRLHFGDISVVPITFVLDPNGEFSTTLYGGQTMAHLNEVIASPIHPQG